QTCAGGICGGGVSTGNRCTDASDCPGQLCNISTQNCVDCINDNQCSRGFICRGDGTCGAGVGGGTAQCATDFDCQGLSCVSGRCLPCDDDLDCGGTGQLCRANQCVQADGGAPRCESQDDCRRYGTLCNLQTRRCEPCNAATAFQCGTGKSCVDGLCRSDSSGGTGDGSVGARCDRRSDCRNNLACFPGNCTPCFYDDMCNGLNEAPHICDVQSGQCRPRECESADECPAGQGCWGVGQCGECVGNESCRAGEVCNSGVCQAPPASSCTGNSQCQNGLACIGNQCRPCTGPGQCSDGFICGDGVCILNETNPGGGGTGTLALGDSCSSQDDQCVAGSVCLTSGGESRCSKSCVGNGRGGDDDCPSGFACRDFSSGTHDGAKFCVLPSQVPSTFAGRPFTAAPGQACSASNNSCQTSVCQLGGVCARACLSNGDCNAGEVCRADNDGNHVCVPSSLSGAGSNCTANTECDSGICAGTCSGGSTPCDSNADCGFGTCEGRCVDHCRSNGDCGNSETCLPWAVQRGASDSDWVSACQAGSSPGSQPNGSRCSAHGDCDSWWCIRGLCTEPCGSNLDCDGGLASLDCGPVTFLDPSDRPVYSLSFCVY
ncbi:MAG: hypothetical protein AAFX94_07970, partial [Myxococcota bacterium]